VLPEWLALLPPWLLVGIALGVLASVIVAGVFVVGDRFFPAAPVDETYRIDGTVRRRAEIRSYLDAIGEPYVEDCRIHGEVVAFYLPRRDVAITFDAQAYFRIERAGTYAVLCEHEMPGAQLGRRLPFDVPELEPESSAVDDPVAAAFERLDLSVGANVDEVRRAYRSKVKAAHPDHGGDRESFRRIREAYVTAKDHAEDASA
jgi:hypothetical protein